MSQVPGSNAAGEVFANFNIQSAPAEAAIDRIGQKAVDTANTMEREVGEKAGKSVKDLSTKALGAAAALGAVIAATDKVLRAIGEWNAASATLAANYRAIDEAAGSISGQLGNAKADFDQLAQAASDFGQAQIDALSKAAQSWDVATLARKAYADIAEVELEEEAQIEQILGRRRQLLESIAKAREEAFSENIAERDRRAAAENQLREANALAAFEKEIQDQRRAGLTEQQRQIEDLEEKLRQIQDRIRDASNPQSRAEFERYADFFAARLRVAMQPVMDEAAERFAQSVQERFTGGFDTSVLTDDFGNVVGKLDAIVAQLQNRGAL